MIFGFTTNYIPLKTLPLVACVCPSCLRKGGLEMTFLQMEQNGVVTQRLPKISGTLRCNICETSIPVGQWNEELKHFFESEKESIPVLTSVKLSAYGKRVIGVALGCFLLVGGIFAADRLGLLGNKDEQPYQKERENTALYLKDPKAGDIYKVVVMEGPGAGQTKYTLFKVKTIDKAADKITVLRHFKDSGDLTWNDLSLAAKDFDETNPLTYALKDLRFSGFEDPGHDKNRRVNILAVQRPQQP
jgi:hypothetical protein